MLLLKLFAEIVRFVILIIIGFLMTLFWLGVMGSRMGRLVVEVNAARVMELTASNWNKSYVKVLKKIRRA